MRIRVTHSVEIGELPNYLKELAEKICKQLEDSAKTMKADFVESLAQERFLAAGNDCDELRVALGNVDVKIQELQGLCNDYQLALVQLTMQQARAEQAAAAEIANAATEVEAEEEPDA